MGRLSSLTSYNDSARAIGYNLYPVEDANVTTVTEAPLMAKKDPRETMPVRLTIEALDAARIAASYQGLNLSEYASAALLEIANRDIERGHQARTQGATKKGKGGPK